MKKRVTKKSNTDKKNHFIGTSHRQNLALLSNAFVFLDKIKQIREAVKIPKEGFERKNAQKVEDFFDKETDKAFSDREFIHKKESIRQRLKNNQIDIKKANELLKKETDKFHINYLKKSINSLIEEFHLPLNYFDSLRSFIIYGEVISVPAKNFVTVYNDEEELKKKKVTFSIYTRLTKEELADLVKEVKSETKHLPKYSEIKKLRERIEIERNTKRTTKDKKTFDEIKLLKQKRKKRFGISE